MENQEINSESDEIKIQQVEKVKYLGAIIGGVKKYQISQLLTEIR